MEFSSLLLGWESQRREAAIAYRVAREQEEGLDERERRGNGQKTTSRAWRIVLKRVFVCQILPTDTASLLEKRKHGAICIHACLSFVCLVLSRLARFGLVALDVPHVLRLPRIVRQTADYPPYIVLRTPHYIRVRVHTKFDLPHCRVPCPSFTGSTQLREDGRKFVELDERQSRARPERGKTGKKSRRGSARRSEKR